MIAPTLPHDLLAERVTLGAILLDRDAILAVGDRLGADDFYLEKHALIYQAMQSCLARRVPPDIATVAGTLRSQEQLDLVGGLATLSELGATVPTAAHIGYYADLIVEAAVRRRLISAGGAIAALGYDQREPLDHSLDGAEQALYAVSHRQRGADFLPMSAVVQEFFEQAQRDEQEQLAPTGLLDLDRELNGGLRPGQLVLLAARPGIGKSGLAMSIAYELGLRRRRSVGVVSLEMGRAELLQRLVAMHTGADTRHVEARVRRGDPELLDALGALAEAPITIEDSAMLSVMDVRSKARRLAAIRPLDLLIVDYLQLLVSSTSAASRVEEVSEISRQLKLLARELRCPVLALSQLSRAVEQRAVKVPQLSDLRESGSLEQDADIVLFVYREEMYEQGAVPGLAEIHIAKQRNGPLGIIPVQFDAATTHFRNLAAATRPR